jgi:hypothetical protein
MRQLGFLIFGAVALGACSESTDPRTRTGTVPSPTNLTYELEVSGDPEAPAGVLLRWDPVEASDLDVYDIYSRRTSAGVFERRASTTSTTFHDVGQPDLEYYVTAVYMDAVESQASNTVFIDERLRLQRPASLSSVSLDGAVHLSWNDNAFAAEPNGFKQYRVYSSSYSLDENLCADFWDFEGTTVSPDFLATALANGVPRCYAVSAESVEGFESLWSDSRADTPRPDARNILLFPMTVDLARSGFRFFMDNNGDGLAGDLELGVVTAGDRTDIDFAIFVDAFGDVFIEPVRTGSEVALFGGAPVADLTSIDWAPEIGYDITPIQAVPGFGYVFQMDDGTGFLSFGAIRMTHVGTDFVILDWSFQTDPGNPELLRGPV